MLLKTLRTGIAVATIATVASLSTAHAADEFF